MSHETGLDKQAMTKVRTSVMRHLRTDRSRIIELFAHPKPRYQREDVLRLTRITESALDRALAGAAVSWEADEDGTQWMPWDDVALLALEEWTPRMIEAALKRNTPSIIPLLNQHRQIRISLPLYLIRFLDHVARTESTQHRVPRNASDIIEYLLDGSATGNDAEINAAIPGFAEALGYPSSTPPTTETILSCPYCGIYSEAAGEICSSCTARHEPDDDGLPELDQDDGG